MSWEHNGTTTPVTQQTRIFWSPTGYQTVWAYEGLRSEIDTLAAGYEVAGIPYTITPGEGPCARLEVTFSGTSVETEDPITTDWIFATRGAVVPIEEHPTWLAEVAELVAVWDDTSESNVQLGLRTLSEYAAGTDTSTLDSGKLADIQGKTDLQPLIRLILAGTKSYLRPEPVLVVKRTYQPTAAYVPSLATVGSVYSNALLDTALDIPSVIYDQMPSGEWLAEEVELQRQSDGAKIVSQSFRYAVEWSPILYPHVS